MRRLVILLGRTWRSWQHRHGEAEPDELIRSELFSIDRLEQHGRSLAAAQNVVPGSVRGKPLADRLRANERVLKHAHATIAAAIHDQRAITPAAEWLLDNFHVVEAQIHEIHEALPGPYYRQLPKLADGPLRGMPRVFGVAWAFVAHSDSRLDPEALTRFVRAYQRVQPLTIGELWAVAITLRLVLVENLRRAAQGLVRRTADRADADTFVEALLATTGVDDTLLQQRARQPLATAFAAQLVMRLRDHDPTVTPALAWLDERLAAQGTSADRIVADEHMRQGATNVTVRNVITSMRRMAAIDWTEFFESVSTVDAALAAGSEFAAMDFPSRDRYRHAVEELARGSGQPELTVVAMALRAGAGGDTAPDDPVAARRRQDPGFHLLGDGRRSFESSLGYRVPLHEHVPRLRRAAGIQGYLAIVGALAAGFVAIPVMALLQAGVAPWTATAMALLAIAPAFDLAVAIVNRCITRQLGPVTLPGLELRDGVPATLRTLIAVPTMLTDLATIAAQVERLEVHFLASPGDDVVIALLSDWTDADGERRPGDDELLAAVRAGIAALNARHGPAPSGARFLSLHRRRVWNAGENQWIGWERKRGKLDELNRWLRGATDTTFLFAADGSSVPPAAVRYVLTLDADTRLPPGTARRLVGKMAHALNRPSLDPIHGRVSAGHAVLQPRITPALPDADTASWFQRVFTGPCGLDPYASAVSDVYQDLLGEGSYAGKGIYDIDAFAAAQASRVPDSTVLSHDLLEGTFARAGLVSDVEVVEDFPARYDVAAARQHRWARGDWQLLPWILGRGRDGSGQAGRSAVPFAGRWKMLDNLRRTGIAPNTVLLLLVSWTGGLPAAAIAAAFVLATILLPGLLPLGVNLLPFARGRRDAPRVVGTELLLACVRAAVTVVLLAHQALLMAHAILTALSRLFVRRRHMLQWLTAAQAGRARDLDTSGFYRRMAASVGMTALVGLWLLLVHAPAWPVALAFLAAWAVAPVVAERLSRPRGTGGDARLDPAAVRTLRTLARRTWAYFETFVGEADHGLPPDNFQDTPRPVVAHRTSPTNIGLYLLSVVAARDFGWISTAEGVSRIEATLDTLLRLERHHGHFYNWYGTRDLRALEPRYVSTVDSGNLAGHLLAVGEACREWQDDAIVPPAWRRGLDDTLGIASAALSDLADDHRTQTLSRPQLAATLAAIAERLHAATDSVAAASATLPSLASLTDTAADLAGVLAAERMDAGSAAVQRWTAALRRGVRDQLRALAELAPGSDRPPSIDAGADDLAAAALSEAPAGLEAFAAHCARQASTLAPDRHEARAALCAGAAAARSLTSRLDGLHRRCGELVTAMQFGFLYVPARQLLAIGYQVDEAAVDPNHYDLLASEARLASFLAIAKGDVPARHWYRLGRGVTRAAGGPVLLSWSGSLFEYLMPSLVLREPAGSLLAETNRRVVRRQIRYGAELGVPWGISESAYNVRDLEQTYQYSSFGVPGLGLKRGLADDIVIAPYATALATMVDAGAAVDNLAALVAAGGAGDYGCHEALDYTPSRRPPGEPVAVVRAVMAHHQGMSLVALDNTLHGGVMRRRFHAAPAVQAAELLLQERPPRGRTAVIATPEPREPTQRIGPLAPPPVRRFHGPHDALPPTHLLSNGTHSLMLTAAGAGYSTWRDLAVTRWREDPTMDAAGSWFYLRDAHDGAVWSAGYQPTRVEPDHYEVSFAEGRAEIVRRDRDLTTALEVTVSPEHDAEVRRIAVTNGGHRVRDIDLTSYAELVLAPQSADAAHPAFSKLFVQTEHVASVGALVATRRRRSADEPEAWAAHLAVVEGRVVGSLQFETDRARFVGRGHTLRAPLAVMDGRPLANTTGSVLDAIFSLRLRLRIEPGQTARVAFWTLLAPSRREVLDLADKHRDPAAFERATTMAWTHAQVQLQHLGIAADEALLFQRLANRVLYSDPSLRPHTTLLQRGCHGPAALWPEGISGDLPIVLVRVDDDDDLELVRQLLRAQSYWRSKRLAVDLVIVNERANSYTQDLHTALAALVRASQPRTPSADARATGRVYVLRSDHLAPSTRTTLQAAARATLTGRRGSLAEQVRRNPDVAGGGPPLPWPRSNAPQWRPAEREAVAPPDTEFWNGMGGFTRGGREYTVTLAGGHCTPAPWINVVANPHFGFQVSAEGAGYTWSGNSRENQLTPWSNDPTCDPTGEALYLRDLDSGAVWSPTPLPARDDRTTFTCRHGQGYSRFEHTAHELVVELLQFVPVDDHIKLSRLRIRNRSGRTRRLSVTAYVEWVLGSRRDVGAHHLVTESDRVSGTLLARNPWREQWSDRVACFDLGGRQTSWTGDRREFLGRNGSADQPRALASDAPLSGRVGAGLDPCGALQATFELAAGASIDLVVSLGEAASRDEAIALATRYRTVDLAAALQAVHDRWNELLEVVQVRTPDRAFDLLVNRWLLYQTVACRLWARSAFYQAGGAYGFRDQLQDTMALVVARPDLARAHLLRAAARQYDAGDVQHWWLPHTGRGVRTRISDDALWLAHATAHYVTGTGDDAVLAELVPFLSGAALLPSEHEAYQPAAASEEIGTLFEHCARALDRSLPVGAHGLPLIGGGDWNDGFNRVGSGGRGESVWLGWFLHTTLLACAPLAEAHGEVTRAAAWRRHAAELLRAIDGEAWDGAWYRRGWFDDGTALGTAASVACRIDSLAQSWAVLAGGGEPARALQAMESLYTQLVRPTDGLVLLFTPPFDQDSCDPGYVRGYPPGIRENGGQYTHAAAWAVMAFAKLGDGDRAAALFEFLNPIRRTRTRTDVHRYKVEPYAVCADVYSMPPHTGRGGWTWYTGSSGVMHRAGIESMLGFRLVGGALHVDPCIPTTWRSYEIDFRRGPVRCRVVVENPRAVSRGVTRVELDGVAQVDPSAPVQLPADGLPHRLRVVLG